MTEVWPLAELFQRAHDLAHELAESIADERRAVLATMATEDHREGMQAFPEKRKPRFNRGPA